MRGGYEYEDVGVASKLGRRAALQKRSWMAQDGWQYACCSVTMDGQW